MRPFPVHPRGPRKRRPRRETVLLALPRSSPEWELAAVHALMKPKPFTRAAIEHRSPEQLLSAAGVAKIRDACAVLTDRLAIELDPQFPPMGDFHLVLPLPAARWNVALAVARVLSRQVPNAWFTLGRVFIQDGTFYNRERGFKLTLRQSTHHRVPRDIAALIRDLV